jgi:hypothetical protein
MIGRKDYRTNGRLIIGRRKEGRKAYRKEGKKEKKEGRIIGRKDYRTEGRIIGRKDGL